MNAAKQKLPLFTAIVVGALSLGCAPQPALGAPASSAPAALQRAPAKSGYAAVNGLQMYYAIHGAGRPLVLLHGGLCTIDTCFGSVLPALAEARQVIAFELQAHGHTADIDRPLTVTNMANDVMAALAQLGIGPADFFGYSMGSAVALEIAIRHPELIRRLVLASVAYDEQGLHPGLLEGMADLTPEMLKGTPWYDAYMKVAPHPEQFSALVEKIKTVDDSKSWPAASIKALPMPVLLVYGDSDIIRPEHAVELFRLLGGGVAGDMVGLPKSQLAMLPGTTHVTLVAHPEWLVSMLLPFLDAERASN